MILVNQPFDVDSAQNKLGAIDCGGVELAMGSRLQSNGISLAAKVDTLMPWLIFSHLPVLQLFAIVWSAIVCPAIVSDLSFDHLRFVADCAGFDVNCV